MRVRHDLLLVAILLIAGRAAAADEFPTGTFILKDADGMWAVTFDGKGNYKVTRDGTERVAGTYTVAKEEIALTDKPPPFAGKDKEARASGTYKWKLDGKKLTFTVVKDENKGRVGIATAGPWEKKE